ncbi:CLUMA_CG020966, isoform A [Clunio marinus]|uniref:CLUMA_CG020966, isoform A n=1 Tax=Clunio marinus TaxID=568069 RepID=A0A1J1J6Y8_9DIPT|nr:CLUMA_CG020966, isoform A [Clunio marinus]
MRQTETPSKSDLNTPAENNDFNIGTTIIDKSEEESEEQFSQYNISQSYSAISEYERQYKSYTKNITKKIGVLPSKKNVESLIKSMEGSCLSTVCKARKDIEDASTESIRKHILFKLGMDHEPNITNYPKITDEFREILCKRINISPENCFGRKLPSNEYQSDAPIAPNNNDYDEDQSTQFYEDERYMSYDNRIYAFPSTAIKPRHKSHLIFQFTESQELNNAVIYATLNLFIHSETYLKSNNIHVPQGIQFLDIEVANILQGLQHKKIYNTYQNISIPKGDTNGAFIQLNITNLVSEWFLSQKTTHGIALKIMFSKTGLVLPHKVISLDSGNYSTRPFIDILPKDQRKKRLKRSSPRCQKGSNESRCCRHELTVDFDKFGWDWIIAPKKYDANYCAGECQIAFLQQYAHTHVMQLSTAANPCCSPRKMTPMQLLYFDSQLNIVLGTIPNMIVEECFCS